MTRRWGSPPRWRWRTVLSWAARAYEPARSLPRDVRHDPPRVPAPMDLPSTWGLGVLPSLVTGAEALVEMLSPAVLLEHPQVETAAAIVRSTPRRDLGHEPMADA